VPPGVAASISHKESWAVALVARVGAGDRARIGVDVEEDRPRLRDVSSRVCTDDELAEIASLDADARLREVILRFSAKEAIYKALDPFVRRYVGFREVAVTPRADGTAEVRPALAAGEGPFAIEVRWRRVEGLVLTTARVCPADAGTMAR
jgi:4'-phosphopantetheinyl transferase EntD